MTQNNQYSSTYSKRLRYTICLIMEYLHITECTYLIFSITYWEYSVTTQFSNSKRCLLYLVNTSGFSYKLETTAKLDSQVQLNILSAICLLFIYVGLSCLFINFVYRSLLKTIRPWSQNNIPRGMRILESIGKYWYLH